MNSVDGKWIDDCDICIDDSWQEKKTKLLNEVVTVISRKSKKVLDVQVFCRFVIHVLNGNHWKVHQNTKNRK